MLTFILGFILGAAAVILRKLRLEAIILADARAELDAQRRRNAALLREIAALQIQQLALGSADAREYAAGHEAAAKTIRRSTGNHRYQDRRKSWGYIKS